MNIKRKESSNRDFKYLELLSMLYITMLLSSVVTTMYLVSIFGFTFNMGAAIIPFMYFLGDVIAEVYGYRYARNLIWYALLCDVVFIVLVVFTVHLPSPPAWHHQKEFQTVLGGLYRLIISGIIVFPLSEFLNIYVLSKSRLLLKGAYFWIRSFSSSVISELTLALIGSLIIFYHVLPVQEIFFIALSSFAIKVVFSFMAIFPATILQNLLKRTENISVNNQESDFNPFKLQLT